MRIPAAYIRHAAIVDAVETAVLALSPHTEERRQPGERDAPRVLFVTYQLAQVAGQQRGRGKQPFARSVTEQGQGYSVDPELGLGLGPRAGGQCIPALNLRL